MTNGLRTGRTSVGRVRGDVTGGLRHAPECSARAQLPVVPSVLIVGVHGRHAPRSPRRNRPVRRTLVVLTSAMMLALALVPAGAHAASRCDPLDKRGCLLPWPSNAYTVLDDRTDTGRRLDLRAEDMPRNGKGKRVSPTEFNRADGFAPGSAILTYVPGINLKRTGVTPVTDLRKSQDRGQPIALVNATTQTRELAWAEIDPAAKGKDRLLVIHPARNLARGQRYIVGLGRMRDDKGRIIKASAAFKAMRDQLQTSDRSLERRRIGFERMFQTLAKVGLKRKDLFQAWDFTVASTPSSSERAVDIRDNAFAVLGDNNLVDRNVKGGAPRYALDAPQEFAPCGTDGCQPGENDLLARTVTGVMTVPCYLNRTGCPVGSTFRYRKLKKTANFQADRFVFYPERKKNNTMQVPFRCIVPRAALGKASRLVLFGHAPYAGQDDVLRPDVQQLAQDGNLTLLRRPPGRLRVGGPRHAQGGVRRRQHLPARRRPPAAGRAQQPPARPADDPPAGPRPAGGLPDARRRARDRPVHRLLRHDQRRRLRRHGHRAVPGQRAGLARHRRHEPHVHAAAQHRLRGAGADLPRRLPAPRRAHAAAHDAAGPVGSRRDGRIRAEPHAGPAPEHPAAHAALPGRRRRPSRPERRDGDRGAHGRGRQARPALRQGPLGRPDHRLRRSRRAASSSSARCSRCGTAGPSAPAASAPRSRRPGRFRRRSAWTRTSCPRRRVDARKQRSDFFNIDSRFIDPCRPTVACRAFGY